MAICSYSVLSEDGTKIRCTKPARKNGKCKAHAKHSQTPRCVRCGGTSIGGPVCDWCRQVEFLDEYDP